MSKTSPTIPKTTEDRFDLSYEALRSEGLKHIEQLAGSLWTDYNTHDPGITMLEVLCYAVTDLGLRADLPMEDLLASPGGPSANADPHRFFTAAEILPSQPLTAQDYRKLFIDVEGVKNAWLTVVRGPDIYVGYRLEDNEKVIESGYAPHPNPLTRYQLGGLYRILFEIEESRLLGDEGPLGKAEVEAVAGGLREKIKDVYHRHRNLCEDLIGVDVVPQRKIALCGEIELEKNADAEMVRARILHDVQLYLTPPVRRYTLREMLDRQTPVEKIFEGPLLTYGFIDDAELEQSALRRRVHLSDVIRVIMQVEGVKTVRDLLLKFCREEGEEERVGPTPRIDWELCVEEDVQLVLCTDPRRTVLNFYKDLLPIRVDALEADRRRQELFAADEAARRQVRSGDLPFPPGRFRDPGRYVSVQHHLPAVYGLGQEGYPDHFSDDHKGRIRQLRAYLLFFDQILANYFAQLAGIRHLLAADDRLRQSYFSQAVRGIPGMEEIFKAGVDPVIAAASIMQSLDDYPERKNRILDHLLARFAERFSDYAYLMYDLYGKSIDLALIRHKTDFLKEYDRISADRALAFDYYHPGAGIWDSTNVAGLQHRLARLTGIRNYARRDLSRPPYEFIAEGSGDETRYRWLLKDGAGQPLLQSPEAYDRFRADDALWQAVVRGWERNHYDTTAADGDRRILIRGEDGQALAESVAAFPPEEVEGTIGRMIDYLYLDLADEGMSVVEHILLRPDHPDHVPEAPLPPPELFMPLCVDEEGNFCEPLDPYSFRVSIVLPGWTRRLSRFDFRRFLERLIRMETPAHILARICWLSPEAMAAFEALYRRYLEARYEDPGRQVAGELLTEFITMLNSLTTVYPVGTLHDCVDEGEEEKDNPIILGRTNLGNL